MFRNLSWEQLKYNCEQGGKYQLVNSTFRISKQTVVSSAGNAIYTDTACFFINFKIAGLKNKQTARALVMVLMQGDASKYPHMKGINNIRLREQWMLLLCLLYVFGETIEIAGYPLPHTALDITFCLSSYLPIAINKPLLLNVIFWQVSQLKILVIALLYHIFVTKSCSFEFRICLAFVSLRVLCRKCNRDNTKIKKRRGQTLYSW